MWTLESDILHHRTLANTLAGFQPGSTCVAWIAGLTMFEAMRVTQRLDQHTLCYKPFVIIVILLTLVLYMTFGAVVFQHAIKDFGNYRALDRIYPVFKYHFLLTRLSIFFGQVYYAHTIWVSELIKTSTHKIPELKIVMTALIGITAGVSCWAIWFVFGHDSYYEISNYQSLWTALVGSQLICDLLLTVIKAYDIVKSGNISRLMGSQSNAQISRLILLMCQTAIIPTAFDLVTVALVSELPLGTKYSLLYTSTKLHLLGPIIAISSSLSYSASNNGAGQDSTFEGDSDPKALLSNIDSFRQKMGNRLDDQRLEINKAKFGASHEHFKQASPPAKSNIERRNSVYEPNIFED